MDDNRKGALLVILAGTCWGVISIFINYLSAAGLGEMQISFLRQLFAVLVFALVILVRDRSKFRIPLKDLALLMLVGFINGVLFNFLYFYTIINSRASIAVVLLYTSPVFVIILARIFFGEKITRNKFIALVLTVAGCLFVTGVIGEGYMRGRKEKRPADGDLLYAVFQFPLPYTVQRMGKPDITLQGKSDDTCRRVPDVSGNSGVCPVLLLDGTQTD